MSHKGKKKQTKKEIFVWHLLSCNPKRVVQVFGQVGTLPFDVVGGPAVQRVLGYSRVYGWWQVPVLLPGISREEGEERKHHKPNRAKHTDTLWAHGHTLNRNFLNQIVRRQPSKCSAQRNPSANEERPVMFLKTQEVSRYMIGWNSLHCHSISQVIWLMLAPPGWYSHDHLLIAAVWMWLGPGKVVEEGSSWYGEGSSANWAALEVC